MPLTRSLAPSLALAAAALFSPFAAAQPWVEAERANQLFREQKYDEAVVVLQAMADANRFDGSAFSQLGYCLHAVKRYDEALKAYATAIDLGYQPSSNLYNSACASALLGRKEEALATLEKALNARFAEQETLENDTDLNSLRDDPRFAALTGITKGLKDQPAKTREAAWAWDLDFFARRMKQMHWDLYANISQDAFFAEIERLKQDIPKLTDSQARASLRRITALVGDGHTASRLTAEGEARTSVPIHMFAFADGLYIIGSSESNAQLLGSKVVKVGPLDAAAAMTAARPYTSVDNDMGYLSAAPAMLASPIILEAIGATDKTGAITYTLEKDGKSRQVALSPVATPSASHSNWRVGGFTYLHDSLDKASQPLFLREAEKTLRTQHLPESKTLYFWFGAIADSHESSLRDFVTSMFKFIEDNGVENLIIDMRFNGGGNTGLIRPFVHGLIASKVNRRGHLFVITGRNTFSAAQNTVNFIDNNTQAIFVGEPTGSRPAFVGESTSFILPHSKTRVYCSSRYWQHMDSTDQRTWVQPDIAAEMTFADYAAGRDAPVDAITKWLAPAATSPTTPANSSTTTQPK